MVDTATDRPVFAHYFDLGVRPMAFDTNPDGSTRNIYIQLTNFDGFAVFDFQKRQEVRRVELPGLPPGEKPVGFGGNASHGIGVTPDNRTLVANNSRASRTYVYSLPDLKLKGVVQVGHSPNWVTITPDSKYAYISVSGENTVAVLDIEAVKVVAKIPVGQVPKRNATMVVTQ